MLISLEGIDGAGKTTQSSMLVNKLTDEGFNVICVRLPSKDTDITCEIREIVCKSRSSGEGMLTETEVALMLATFIETTEKDIKPSLEQGKIVVCDRYYDSTLVYQGRLGGADKSMIEKTFKDWLGIKPDLTLLLDITIDNSRNRVRSRGGHIDKFEAMSDDVITQMRSDFIALAEKNIDRFSIIDANIVDQDQIHNAILATVKSSNAWKKYSSTIIT